MPEFKNSIEEHIFRLIWETFNDADLGQSIIFAHARIRSAYDGYQADGELPLKNLGKFLKAIEVLNGLTYNNQLYLGFIVKYGTEDFAQFDIPDLRKFKLENPKGFSTEVIDGTTYRDIAKNSLQVIDDAKNLVSNNQLFTSGERETILTALYDYKTAIVESGVLKWFRFLEKEITRNPNLGTWER